VGIVGRKRSAQVAGAALVVMMVGSAVAPHSAPAASSRHVPTASTSGTSTSAPAPTSAAAAAPDPTPSEADGADPQATVVAEALPARSPDLPDRALTPGSVFAGITAADVCLPGYARQARHVTTATRMRVFSLYGIAYPPPSGSYELDHLVPLELGGDNEVSNLWPQPYHRGVARRLRATGSPPRPGTTRPPQARTPTPARPRRRRPALPLRAARPGARATALPRAPPPAATTGPTRTRSTTEAPARTTAELSSSTAELSDHRWGGWGSNPRPRDCAWRGRPAVRCRRLSARARRCGNGQRALMAATVR
jgi:hypothetical protein